MRNINKPTADLKRAYLKMAKDNDIKSVEVIAHAKELAAKRKRANLTASAAKEATEIQLEARKYTSSILEEMISIATSETAVESAKIQAAHFVFDRAYGKASQTHINANVITDGKPSEITAAALTDRVTAALKRIEALTGGGEPPPASEEQPADVCLGDINTGGSTKH